MHSLVAEESGAQARGPRGTSRIPRLFLLEASGNRIHAMNPDGSYSKVIVTDCRLPDGIAVDADRGHIYWTNMGNPKLNDGSIERVDLDGRNRRFIVAPGLTHTPKQIHLDRKNGKLYWCDREGMRVMRANLDGSEITTLVETGRGDEDARDETRWCVGITIDLEHGKIYWSQKGPENAGLGRIFRAGIDIPEGEEPNHRSDVEVVFDHLPEPIDLELDEAHRMLYWTDRGDPPRGNTVNRAPLDSGATPEILLTHLVEAIGLALDVPGNRLFATDLGGSVLTADLEGRGRRALASARGNLTGIAYAEIPITAVEK
jgi:hypothetical protein